MITLIPAGCMRWHVFAVVIADKRHVFVIGTEGGRGNEMTYVVFLRPSTHERIACEVRRQPEPFHDQLDKEHGTGDKGSAKK